MKYIDFLLILIVGFALGSCAKPREGSKTNLPANQTIVPSPTVLPTLSLTTGTLKGQIFRSDTGELLEGVNVALFIYIADGSPQDVAKIDSDKQGSFTFADIEPDYYHLSATLKLKTQAEIDNAPCLILPGSSTVTLGGTWITMGIQNDGIFFLTAVESIGDIKASDVIERNIDLNCHSQ
jgi:hypothetical protein